MPGTSRRRLLKLGVGSLLVVALGAGGLAAIQPRRVLRRPRRADDEALPERAASPARVVVVGGGLAGIAAATALAERGLRVTLLEQAPQLGGKIAGWKVSALGETVHVEHGFHGFFKHYYNLHQLLDAAGATADLTQNTSYPLLFGDRPTERFGTTTSVFPINLMSVIAQSETLGFGDFAKPSTGLLELMRHDPERTPSRWDDTDFLSFAQDNDIPAAMIDTVLRPFAETSLNAIERMSAAYAINFFHFYFMGNPEGLAFDVVARDLAKAVVDPLVARMRSLGVDVRTGARVSRLEMGQDGVRSVVIAERLAAAPTEDALASAAVLEGSWTSARDDRGGPAWVTRQDGQLRALSATCTHLFCPVKPDPARGGFLCPCHGGRYDAQGQVAAGPPERPLASLIVVEQDGRVTLRAPERPEEEILCDWCVLACDVPGVRALIAGSAAIDPDLAARVAALGTAGPYLVTRVWLDRPVLPERDPFYTVSRYRYTDALALYSRFQEPFIGWAARTGGAVIELHAYAIGEADLLPTDAILEAMHAEMLAMLPELEGCAVLHRETQLQDNFSRFAPGDHATRPTTRTPVPNLMLAGDHVAIDVSAHLMEGAVVSGRLAANEILSALGLREQPIPMVDPRGPLP